MCSKERKSLLGKKLAIHSAAIYIFAMMTLWIAAIIWITLIKKCQLNKTSLGSWLAAARQMLTFISKPGCGNANHNDFIEVCWLMEVGAGHGASGQQASLKRTGRGSQCPKDPPNPREPSAETSL